MGVMTSADYLSQLQALLPPGSGLSKHPASNLTALLAAFADVLAEVDAAFNALYDEADPTTTTQLLTDWERIAALPDPAAGSDYQSVAERRAWLMSRLTGVGGQSAAYFIDLAAQLGTTISITEFSPWGCGFGQCGRDPISGDGTVAMLWRVNMPVPPTYFFQAGLSQCGDPLGYCKTGVIEALFQRWKPAHTTLIFNYSSEG